MVHLHEATPLFKYFLSPSATNVYADVSNHDFPFQSLNQLITIPIQNTFLATKQPTSSYTPNFPAFSIHPKYSEFVAKKSIEAMDICPKLNITSTIIDGFPLELWEDSLAHLALCGGNTYLRPDAGGALQPYIWTILEIILHTPTCILRLAKWEKVQMLSLCIAGLNIIISTQAYTSTKLDPSQVLVWNPVVLILDAGAMLQIYILILEKIKFRGFLRNLRRGATAPFLALSSRFFARFNRGTTSYSQAGSTESGMFHASASQSCLQ
jgi:hypothetical protein